MPKQKTHKGLAKRVKITGTGKVKRKKAFSGHLMSGKTAGTRRRLSKSTSMSLAMARKTKIALGV